jgi:hypothetical protein
MTVVLHLPSSWHRSVTTVTGNGLDVRGSIPNRGEIFSSLQHSVRLCGQPSLSDIGDPFPGGKMVSDYLPLSSVQVKDMWSYTSTPPIRFSHDAYIRTGETLPFYLHSFDITPKPFIGSKITFSYLCCFICRLRAYLVLNFREHCEQEKAFGFL